ncbi:MAG: hypothetical protein OXL96_01250 [Candidatus Poribacteria bacterium]|nr:hypothetical protein [Candidatus Poribacteria bacterium]
MVCKGCGISVYTDLQDIKRLKDRYKGKFGKYKIAEGELDAKFGTIQNTPSKENLIILGGCLLEQNLGPFLA